MENKDFESISFDYYENTPSYVKMIVDMLPESKASRDKKYIIKELYNYRLNHMSEEQIEEVITISKLFREKIAVAEMNTIANQVEYIYSSFLNKFVFDSLNRNTVFDIMNECVKLFSGYYDTYNKNIRNESSVIMNTSTQMKRR